MLLDANFHRTVVLLLEHGEQGAVGVVLNRPSELRAAELVDTWADVLSPPAVVHVGGPVSPQAAICLGSVDQIPQDNPAWQTLFGSIGALDLNAEPSLAPSSLVGVRVFAGYSGWSAGQLEVELDAGGWFVLDAHSCDVFSRHSADLWHDVLARQTDEIRSVAYFPSDPADN